MARNAESTGSESARRSSEHADREHRLHLLRRELSDFRALETEELLAIEQSFEATRQLSRRDLAWQSDDAEACYLVTEGWLVRSVTLRDNRRQILDFLLPGDIVCAFAGTRETTVEDVHSLTRSRVVVLPPDRLRWLREDYCHLAYALFSAAARVANRLTDQVVRLGRLGAHERTAHLLLDLLMRLQRVGLANSQRYSLPLTQVELADALGLSPMHLNRVFRALTRDGLVEVSGRAARTSITICDVQRLAEAGAYDLVRPAGG
jgi:CRP-like cAMP-binding protein